MRTLAVLVASPLLLVPMAGCTSTMQVEPELRVSPYLAVYELRGDVGMQSLDAGSPPALQNNPQQPMRRFGQDKFREDVGVRADLGDGFGGLRADYYKLDMNTSRSGTLTHDWGRLLAGDQVSIYAEMDELRLAYLEPIWDIHTQYRGEDLRIRIAGGGAFATRSMRLRGKKDDNTRQQNLKLDGDVVYGAVRARAEWQQFAFEVDYAIATDEMVLGGEMGGISQDLEARLSYELPQRDIRLFVGARYSELSASGDANGFGYDADLVIDGLQFGASVTF